MDTNTQKSLYSDVNKIINNYLTRNEDISDDADPEIEKAETDANKKGREATVAKIAALKAQIRDLEAKLNEEEEVEEDSPEPVEAEENPVGGTPKEVTEDDKDGGPSSKDLMCQIHQSVTSMMKQIEDSENLPDWVHSKIAVANDYVVKVGSFLDAKNKKADDQGTAPSPATPLSPAPAAAGMPAPSGMLRSALGGAPPTPGPYGP
jgi:hypothetical protein